MYPPIKLRSTPSLWLKGGRLNYIRVPRIPQGFHACRTGAASPGSCGVCRCVEYMEKGPAVGVGWWCKCHTVIKMKRAASKDKEKDKGEKEKDESVEDEGPACQSCRKKKAKCSREQPCSHCARMNIECQYDESRSRPGVKAGVIESLSQRLDTLEKMFIGQTLVTRQLLSAIRELNPNLGPKSPGNLAQLSDCGSPSKPLDLLTAEISGLKRELLQASSPATSGSGVSAKRQRLNNHHDVSPRSYQQPTSDPELSQQRRPTIVDLLDCEDSSLPPADLVDILVHLYFDLIHPWIPILHKTSFLRRLESVTTRPALSTILHAIVAATVRFSADKRLERKEVRDRYFRISRQTVILKSMEMFSVENLQALVIIAFDTIGSGRGPKSWAIVDSMTRTVEHLQLSFEDDAEGNTGNGSAHRLINRMNFLGPSKTWTEGEERRRVFWNVFLLDRFCSVATGWNTSLTSADVRRRLPCEGAIWEAEKPVRTRYFGISDNSGTQNIRRQNGGAPLISDPFPSDSANNSNGFYSDEVVNLGGFSYCIEATELLSQVTRFFLQQAVDLKSPEEVQQWLMRFKELDLRLVRWKLFLPPQWREATVVNGKMDPNLTLAHITHNTSVILLHQGIAYPSIQWQTLSIKLPSSSSADTCLSAAVEITTITQQYLIHNTGLTNPQFAFCLFVSGRVLLAHASFYNTELRPEFVTLVKALFDISKRWRGLYADHDNAYNLPAGFAQRLLQAQAQSDPKNTLFSDSTATGSVDISKPAYSDHFDSDEFLQMTGKGMNGKNGQHMEPEPLELASPPMPLSFQAPASHVGNVNYPYGDSLEHQQDEHQHFDNGYNGVIDHSDGGIFTVEQLAEFSNLFSDPQFAGFDRVLTYGGGM